MILKTTTDFEDAWQLLGRYQQEVMQTGIIDYPLQYVEDIQIPLEEPEQFTSKIQTKEIPNSQETSTQNSATSVNNFDPSCDLAVVSFTVVKELISDSTNPPVQPVKEVISPTADKQISKLREKLLDQQAEEHRLFYLYVHR